MLLRSLTANERRRYARCLRSILLLKRMDLYPLGSEAAARLFSVDAFLWFTKNQTAPTHERRVYFDFLKWLKNARPDQLERYLRAMRLYRHKFLAAASDGPQILDPSDVTAAFAYRQIKKRAGEQASKTLPCSVGGVNSATERRRLAEERRKEIVEMARELMTGRRKRFFNSRLKIEREIEDKLRRKIEDETASASTRDRSKRVPSVSTIREDLTVTERLGKISLPTKSLRRQKGASTWGS